MNYFKFKQFTILQDKCAMKVGTDGVLLGAWCHIQGKNALDIGCGTGLISIMLAQRNHGLRITGVEIDPDAAHQASNNMFHSPWSKRLTCLHQDFQTYAEKCPDVYDLIVSNPPYFNDSLKGPLDQRNQARHADQLSQEDLLEGVDKLLSPQGTFSLILPYVEGNLLIALAAQYRLHCTRKTSVFSKRGKGVKRLLLEFRRECPETCRENHLYIEGAELNSFTQEYQTLTKDFYLKF